VTKQLQIGSHGFFPERNVRDYVTFGYLLSQIRLSSVCYVHAPYQPVDIFGNVSIGHFAR